MSSLNNTAAKNAAQKPVATSAPAAPAPAPAPVAQKAVDPAKKAEQEKRNAERKAALLFIRSKLGELSADVQAALKVLLPVGERAAKATGMFAQVIELFTKNDKMDEFAIFKALKIGRGEMRMWARRLVKDVPANERIWIRYDEATESWIVAGKGVDAPAGWKGYTPDSDK